MARVLGLWLLVLVALVVGAYLYLVVAFAGGYLWFDYFFAAIELLGVLVVFFFAVRATIRAVSALRRRART